MPGTAGTVLCLVKPCSNYFASLGMEWCWGQNLALKRRNSYFSRGAVFYYWGTFLFRPGSSPARDKIFIWKKCVGCTCMWFGCHLLVAVVSQAYPGDAEICTGFPPPQAALRIIFSTEGDTVHIDKYVSAIPSPIGAVVTNDWCIISHLTTRIRAGLMAGLWSYKCTGIAKRKINIPAIPCGDHSYKWYLKNIMPRNSFEGDMFQLFVTTAPTGLGNSGD